MNENGIDHRWDEELPAYALGALDTTESIELERHLHDCPRCQERLRWLQGAIDVLPESVEQLEPPPRLRRELMAQVRTDARAAQGGRRQWWKAGDRVSFRLGPVLALTCAGLLVAGGVGYAISSTAGDSSDEPIVAQATPDAPGATASLDRQDDGAGFHAVGMPALSGGDVYQLWVEVDGKVQPSSTFRVGDDGSGYAWIPSIPEGASAVMVTREPHGGSEAPTSPVLLRAAV